MGESGDRGARRRARRDAARLAQVQSFDSTIAIAFESTETPDCAGSGEAAFFGIRSRRRSAARTNEVPTMELSTLSYNSKRGWSEKFPALDSDHTLLLVFGAPSFGDDG